MIISLEGPDSSGKSTQAEILYNSLIDMGLKVKLFHFPRYESPIGGLIGKILKGKYNFSFESLQKLYIADQKDFKYELRELVFDGYVVILDRYDLSTIAYYTAKENISSSEGVNIISSWQGNLIRPDITFIFDIENSLSRRDSSSFDMIEKDKSITENINRVYLEVADILSKDSIRRFQTIDASQTKEDISIIIWETIKKCNRWRVI